ncbi:MAG: alpha/beta hydrolase [Candidatus Rokubacteria bacterium]|nr:alpha/beta hydrolase [Candidatus Rokubacteria bacterium]
MGPGRGLPVTAGTRHAYADVNGVRLHYACAGAGPLVVFLHGFPEFWYEWRRQLEEFGRDHLAVAPDMRGYNLSSRPEGVAAYRVADLVEDVRALAAHLGHARLTLVGHDWGGVVAWAFALAHPAALDRLVIVNAPHPGVFARELRENPAQQQASQYMLVFRSPEAEAILAADGHARLRQALREVWDARLSEEDRRMYLEAWSRPGALTGGLNYYRAAGVGPPSPAGEPARGGFGLGAEIPVLEVPTLVIWGERDRALPTGNLVGLDRYVRRLTVRRVPEGSHWVIHEEPALINGWIREFIGG